MRPLPRYSPPKPRDYTHTRRAALRQVLLAGAISALIISGYVNQSAPPDVPITLQGPVAQQAGDCQRTWSGPQAQVELCLQSWWMLEPHDSLTLTLSTRAQVPVELHLERTPPPQIQRCLQAALDSTAWPSQSCTHQQTIALPPG